MIVVPHTRFRKPALHNGVICASRDLQVSYWMAIMCRIRKVYIKVNYVSFCGRLAANPWFALCGSRYTGYMIRQNYGMLPKPLSREGRFGKYFNAAQECSVLIYVCDTWDFLDIFMEHLWKREKPVKQLRLHIFH